MRDRVSRRVIVANMEKRVAELESALVRYKAVARVTEGLRGLSLEIDGPMCPNCVTFDMNAPHLSLCERLQDLNAVLAALSESEER